MERCRTCGQSAEWHKKHRPRHPFVGVGGEIGDLNKKEQQPKTSVMKGLSNDPALRVALVEAGVISYAQIMAAEEKLRDAAGRGQAIVIDTDATNGHAISVVGSRYVPNAEPGHRSGP